MVSALDRMMTAQQRLLSDISHELRTRSRAAAWHRAAAPPQR
jgi:signal transduction histidine kinase